MAQPHPGRWLHPAGITKSLMQDSAILSWQEVTFGREREALFCRMAQSYPGRRLHPAGIMKPFLFKMVQRHPLVMVLELVHHDIVGNIPCFITVMQHNVVV